jgi:hypothetical protein
VGLSLSAAIVAISQYANAVTSDGRTGPDPYDSAILSVSICLGVYSALAPVLALAIVLATGGTGFRVRFAVGLLVLASIVSSLRDVLIAQFGLDAGMPFVSAANLVYVAATVLVAFAASILWREQLFVGSSRPHLPRFPTVIASALGGAAVAAVVVIGWADAGAVWAARDPLRFGLEFTDSNPAAFEDWLTLKLNFEALVSTVLGSWLFVGLVIAGILALTGLLRGGNLRRAIALSLGAFCLAVLSYGAIVGFLALADSSVAPTVPVDVAMLVARWGLIAIVLVTATGSPGRSTVSRRTLPYTEGLASRAAVNSRLGR